MLIPYNSIKMTKTAYMFDELENELYITDPQICLICDFYPHTSDVNDFVIIDNNTFDVMDINDDDQLTRNLRTLEECLIPIARYFQNKSLLTGLARD